jgi:hypothetical protein
VAAHDEPLVARSETDRWFERFDDHVLAPTVPELAGLPAGDGLFLRRLEVGRQLTVQRCRDDVTRPGAHVDVLFSRSRARRSRSSGSMRFERLCFRALAEGAVSEARAELDSGDLRPRAGRAHLMPTRLIADTT